MFTAVCLLDGLSTNKLRHGYALANRHQMTIYRSMMMLIGMPNTKQNISYKKLLSTDKFKQTNKILPYHCSDDAREWHCHKEEFDDPILFLFPKKIINS
jgi:hypothetical protein